jgi:hypothetical protein
LLLLGRLYAEATVGEGTFRPASSHLEKQQQGAVGGVSPLRHDRRANTHDGFPTLPCLWLAKKTLSE